MRIVLFLVVFSFFHITHSQNLIPNGQLESYNDCPSGLRQLHKVNSWYSASAGTPEYFNTCGFTASINPKEGDGMLGLILYSDYYVDIEYAGVELRDSLIKGKTYRLEFYVYVDKKSPYLIDKIGAFFSPTKLKLEHWNPISKKPQVFLKQTTEANRWMKFEETFVAEGGEKFMTIGNFFEKNEIKLIQNSPKRISGWYCYYYFDDFSLSLSENNKAINSENSIRNLNISNYQKKHIVYFKSNKFDISLDEFNKLNEFMFQIPKNEKVQIQITGHTDSDASLAYNLDLSKNRMEEVSKCLLNKFSWKLIKLWKGEESPTNTNKNAFEKSQNRRVEISIIP